MVISLTLFLLLAMASGYFIAKKHYLGAACALIVLVPVAYFSALLVSLAFKPTHVIACTEGQLLNQCSELKAEMAYDTGDGIFTVNSLQLSDGSTRKLTGCEIVHRKYYSECTDDKDVRWILAASWK
jgi:hypothetical protein